MLQVFLSCSSQKLSGFENEDGFPVSERLLSELNRRFPEANKAGDSFYTMGAGQALTFLRDFYDRYELSQPQRRIWARFEKVLAENLSESPVWFVAADVSEHRSRKFSKKT